MIAAFEPRADLVGAPVTVSGEMMWDDLSPPGEVRTSGAEANVVTGEVEVEKAGVRTTVAILQGTMVPILPRP